MPTRKLSITIEEKICKEMDKYQNKYRTKTSTIISMALEKFFKINTKK